MSAKNPITFSTPCDLKEQLLCVGLFPIFGVGMMFPLHFPSPRALEVTRLVLVLLLVLGCANSRPRSALLSPDNGIVSPSLCPMTAQQIHGGKYGPFSFCFASTVPLPVAFLGPGAPPGQQTFTTWVKDGPE